MQLKNKADNQSWNQFTNCSLLLQDTLDRVKANLELMDKLGFYFGAKIVRGAYMAQERNHAADMGYDDPIHNSYEDTCSMYDQVVETVLQRVSHTPAEVMVASHNEESVQLAVQRYGNVPIIFKHYTVSCLAVTTKCPGWHLMWPFMYSNLQKLYIAHSILIRVFLFWKQNS